MGLQGRRLSLTTTRPNRALASLPPGIEPFLFLVEIIAGSP
jgi:hypothetical protein